MPEALAALVVYDPEGSADENLATMADAAAAVITGEVTQAVRDSASDVGPITTGDWIGIVRGDGIVAVSGTLEGASLALLDHLVEPGREILTVITGAGAPRHATDAIEAWAGEQHPDLQLEIHRGGQPLYPFLFGVE
jgi:dihydroxyacetone kinase-like predicted kinase